MVVDFQLAAAVSSYGVGTRSHNRSMEARLMKVARKEATEKYLQSSHEEFIVGPICTCRSFRLPHELNRHRELRNDHDWRLPR